MNRAQEIIEHQNYAIFSKQFSEDAESIKMLALVPEWDEASEKAFWGIMCSYDEALRPYNPGIKRMIVEGKEVEVRTNYLGNQ